MKFMARETTRNVGVSPDEKEWLLRLNEEFQHVLPVMLQYRSFGVGVGSEIERAAKLTAQLFHHVSDTISNSYIAEDQQRDQVLHLLRLPELAIFGLDRVMQSGLRPLPPLKDLRAWHDNRDRERLERDAEIRRAENFSEKAMCKARAQAAERERQEKLLKDLALAGIDVEKLRSERSA
jgi:hypothetical protein